MFFEPAQQGGTDTELDSAASPAAQGHLARTTQTLTASGKMCGHRTEDLDAHGARYEVREPHGPPDADSVW